MTLQVAVRSGRQPEHYADVSFEIVLLPKRPFYEPGDCIAGKLIVSHSNPQLRLRGLKVSLQGTSTTRFKQLGDVMSKTHTFLDSGTYVVPVVQGGTEIPAGRQAYPFLIRIPSPAPSSSLPSSFSSEFGRIIYNVAALVDISLGTLSPAFVTKAEKTVRIRGSLELDPEPPIEWEKVERRFGFGGQPCARYWFKTATSGFCMGEEVAFEMRTANCDHTGGPLLGTVSLVLKTTYHGGIVSRAWKDTFKVVSWAVKEHVGESWKGVLAVGRVLQPTYTCSSCYGGPVIEFRYLLRVRLESKQKQRVVFSFEKPVKVGTAPRPVADGLGLELLSVTQESRNSNRRASDASQASRPPRYSMLSLLTQKSKSFETLPPPYDEIVPCK